VVLYWIEAARNMFAEGIDLDVIQRVTGLSKEELKQL